MLYFIIKTEFVIWFKSDFRYEFVENILDLLEIGDWVLGVSLLPILSLQIPQHRKLIQ